MSVFLTVPPMQCRRRRTRGEETPLRCDHAVGDELSGDSKSKRTRLESGQLVKSDKLKLGELYEKWQKKTNRSIGRTGVFDDVTEDAGTEDTTGVSRKGQKGGGKTPDDERKSAASIRKEREKKEKNVVKNMKREDRRQFERKQRFEKAAGQDNPGKKGRKGKKGPTGRWKAKGQRR